MPRSGSLSHCSRRRFVVSLELSSLELLPLQTFTPPPFRSVCLVCQTVTEKQLNASLPVKIGIKAKTMTQ